MAQLRHFFNLNLKNLPSKVGRIFVLIASAGLVQHQKKHELASEDISFRSQHHSGRTPSE